MTKNRERLCRWTILAALGISLVAGLAGGYPFPVGFHSPDSGDATTNAFQFSWVIPNTNQVTVPFRSGQVYTGTVYWGDTLSDSFTNDTSPTHSYTGAGTYQVSIAGPKFYGIYFNAAGDKLLPTSVDQWGDAGMQGNPGGFYGCSNILTASLGDVSVGTNVTLWRNCFRDCDSLVTAEVPVTAKATELYSMFWGCHQLLEVNTEDWVTTGATRMDSMFASATVYPNAVMTNFSTPNLVNINSMFITCSALTNFNGAGWDVDQVTTVYRMFYNDILLQRVNLTGWDLTNCTTLQQTFYNCDDLHTITGLESLNVSTNCTTLDLTFYDCDALAFVCATNWNTSKVIDMDLTFYSMGVCTQINITGWDGSSCTTFEQFINNAQNLVRLLGTSNLVTDSATSLYRGFRNTYDLIECDVSGWDTRNVTDWTQTFNNFGLIAGTNAATLDAREFSFVSGVQLNGTFQNNYWQTNLPFINVPTNCTSMNDFYGSCYSTTGDLSKLVNNSTVLTAFGCYNCSNMTYEATNGFFTGMIDDILIEMQDMGLASQQVSYAIMDLDASTASNGTLNIGGVNEYPTAAGIDAATNLGVKGWTITLPSP